MPIEAGVSVEMNIVEAVMKQVNELSKLQVLVGFPAATASRSGEPINNASLAYVMEHGSPARNIPARPFLGPAVNAMQDKAVAMLRQAADLQLHNEPGKASNALDALGLAAQAAVRNKIVSGPFVPNAPSTVARKGSDRPLIDTGAMLAAVNYVVRKKGAQHMPELDVTELLTDPDLVDDVTVLRSVRLVDNNGIVTDTPAIYLTYGSQQPTPATTLRMLPESVRASGYLTIVTPFELLALSDTTAPDQITWHGKSYRVRSVEPWGDWGEGFFIAIAELIAPTQGLASTFP